MDERLYSLESCQTHRFFEIWTKKESQIKWEGMGLAKPLPSFSVLDPNELENVEYHNVFQNSEAVCHVCTTKGEDPIVKVINTVFLMSDIKLIP